MSIVTTAQAVPNRLYALYHSLFAAENGENLAKLEAWATPTSLKGGVAEEDDEPSTTLFTNTLLEAKRLGLVQEVDGRLLVTREAKGDRTDKADPEQRFRDFLLRTLFDTSKAEDLQHAAFMPAVCWFLSNDPGRPLSFSKPPQDRLQAELGENRYATDLTSLNRYQNLLYWVRYLGFGVIIGGGEGQRNRLAVPDPTQVIMGSLPAIFANEPELSADVFMARLASIYPVFEGGTARVVYNAMLLNPPEVDGPPRLSLSTSLALRRLADRQVLGLESVADAPFWLLSTASTQERVSHLKYRRAS